MGFQGYISLSKNHGGLCAPTVSSRIALEGNIARRGADGYGLCARKMLTVPYPRNHSHSLCRMELFKRKNGDDLANHSKCPLGDVGIAIVGQWLRGMPQGLAVSGRLTYEKWSQSQR